MKALQLIHLLLLVTFVTSIGELITLTSVWLLVGDKGFGKIAIQLLIARAGIIL